MFQISNIARDIGYILDDALKGEKRGEERDRVVWRWKALSELLKIN